MHFQIYSGETMIGQSDLDQLDPPMGIATGDFLPSKNYKSVQPVFRLYIEATIDAAGQKFKKEEMIERYYQERDNLHLTVRLSNAEVVPVEWVHIKDFSAELGEMQITIAASNAEAFSIDFEQKTLS